jgi:hypothetical protein
MIFQSMVLGFDVVGKTYFEGGPIVMELYKTLMVEM